MTTKQTSPDALGYTGQNLVRILIASYFIGVSLGLINGTDATTLAATFLPSKYAVILGCTLTLALSYMVLTGLCLRTVALSLGALIFASSYVATFTAAGDFTIGDFWRDLTLVGALMLTYVSPGPRAARHRSVFRIKPRLRRLKAHKRIMPRRIEREAALSETFGRKKRHARPTPAPATMPSENIFLDDPAL